VPGQDFTTAQHPGNSPVDDDHHHLRMPATRSSPHRCRAARDGRCRPDPAGRAHHDLLLRVETDPDAMLELFDMAVTWAELDYPAGSTIPPARWPDFAQRHNWDDPERVTRIFDLATDIALRAVRAAPAAELELTTGR
jgi:hypothetical protein